MYYNYGRTFFIFTGHNVADVSDNSYCLVTTLFNYVSHSLSQPSKITDKLSATSCYGLPAYLTTPLF